MAKIAQAGVPFEAQGKPVVVRGLTLGLERSLGWSLARALAKAWERERADTALADRRAGLKPSAYITRGESSTCDLA
jgi:hypothetical protein